MGAARPATGPALALLQVLAAPVDPLGPRLRRCNARDDISGALICRGDVYLQLLEGPPVAVNTAFSRIAKDNRHEEVAAGALRHADLPALLTVFARIAAS